MSYYEQDSYYTKNSPEHQKASQWFGRGAKELGLFGAVAPKIFQSLLDGKVPNDGPQLGRMIEGKLVHDSGIDLTFSAPKSLSILAEIGPDRILRKIHDNAVKQTLSWMEENVLETRRYSTKTNKQVKINDQKMVAALFQHDTSRNLDPQLHTHCVIANMVQDDDGKWRSVNNNSLYKNKMLLGAQYRSHLSYGLQRLGIKTATTHSDGRFEISGFPKELIDLFSSRSKEIREISDEFGTNNPAILNKIAVFSRQAKNDIDRTELRHSWKQKIQELGYTVKQLTLHYSRKFINREKSSAVADKAIKFSKDHLSERSAVFTEQNIKIQAMGFAIGKANTAHINTALSKAVNNGTLLKYENRVNDEVLYTTPKMVELEKAILDQEDRGRRTVDQLLPSHIVDQKLENSFLNAQQRNAVKLSMTSVNRIIAIQGNAGTGKTTLLKELKKLSNERGVNIIGLAPSASAANTLSSEAKIPSQTLSLFLTKYDGVVHDRLTEQGRKTLTKEYKNTVLVLDEASFASSKQMHGLLKIANSLNIPKLILVGDTKQLDAVDAGTPFSFLQQNGMSTAYVTKIVRQKNLETKSIVENTIAGAIDKAFNILGQSIYEHKDSDIAHIAADKWLELPPAIRSQTGIIAPTHDLVDNINQRIHDKLKDRGEIGGNSLEIETLKSVNLTTAEKLLAKSYQPEDRVLFNHDYKSLKINKGDLWTVSKVDHEKGLVHLTYKDRSIEWYPARVAAKRQGGIEIFSANQISLSENEVIQWTKNNHKKDISNNESGKVLKISNSAVTIQSERGFKMILGTHDPQLKHLKYAYAGTIHASQGKTVDNVIAVMESGRPVLNNQKSFYVTISRPRDTVKLITDDTVKLQSTIERHTGESLSALDLFNHHKHDEIGKSPSTQIDDQMLNPERSSDHQQEKEETKIDEMSIDNDRQMDIEM